MNPVSTANTSNPDRETLIQQRLHQLRELADSHLRAMAEKLVDTPPEKLFGAIELTLRDEAHKLAATAHQVALESDKKGGTAGPVESAPNAKPMPDTSAIDPETS